MMKSAASKDDTSLDFRRKDKVQLKIDSFVHSKKHALHRVVVLSEECVLALYKNSCTCLLFKLTVLVRDPLWRSPTKFPVLPRGQRSLSPERPSRVHAGWFRVPIL